VLEPDAPDVEPVTPPAFGVAMPVPPCPAPLPPAVPPPPPPPAPPPAPPPCAYTAADMLKMSAETNSPLAEARMTVSKRSTRLVACRAGTPFRSIHDAIGIPHPNRGVWSKTARFSCSNAAAMAVGHAVIEAKPPLPSRLSLQRHPFATLTTVNHSALMSKMQSNSPLCSKQTRFSAHPERCVDSVTAIVARVFATLNLTSPRCSSRSETRHLVGMAAGTSRAERT